ncbi:MAG: response regulator [Chloroflexota bacterium]|nr:response regulator [Chloroflexota bacterium]
MSVPSVMESVYLQGKRIFVVEDNVENRVIMRLSLIYHGARIDSALGVHNVAARIRAFSPVDVVLLDLMFPNGGSGYQVYDVIRGDVGLCRIPIVAVSASEPAEAMPKCRAKGFNGFIAKPIDDDIFAGQIADIINGKSVWYAGSQF